MRKEEIKQITNIVKLLSNDMLANAKIIIEYEEERRGEKLPEHLSPCKKHEHLPNSVRCNQIDEIWN